MVLTVDTGLGPRYGIDSVHSGLVARYGIDSGHSGLVADMVLTVDQVL